ncbi:hypothetical protein D3C81_1258040 [compost metagenome]
MGSVPSILPSLNLPISIPLSIEIFEVTFSFGGDIALDAFVTPVPNEKNNDKTSENVNNLLFFTNNTLLYFLVFSPLCYHLWYNNSNKLRRDSVKKSKIVYIVGIFLLIIFFYIYSKNSTTTIVTTQLEDFDSRQITIIDPQSGKDLTFSIDSSIQLPPLKKDTLYTLIFSDNIFPKPRLDEMKIVV